MHNIYKDRINKIIDYISENLDQDLKLENLAKQAYISPFHFHRIFSSIMSETLADFIFRIRMERAISQIIKYKDKLINLILIKI